MSCPTASSGDAEQEISPYWETVFRSSWSPPTEVRDVPAITHSPTVTSAVCNHGDRSSVFQGETISLEDRETSNSPAEDPG